jgi:hypothetical protein
MWFLIIWVITIDQIGIQGIIPSPNMQSCFEMQNNVNNQLQKDNPVVAVCHRIDPPRSS